MQLKISSITNLTDARFFSAIGAHYLGFNFDVLNENNISIAQAKEIIQWLHEIQIPFEHPQKNELAFDKFLILDLKSTVDSRQSTDYFVLKINSDDIENIDLKNFISTHKVFLETDFTKDNIQQIIKTLQPFGFQITCKKEEKAGFSFVDEYAELLEMIGIILHSYSWRRHPHNLLKFQTEIRSAFLS